MSLPHGAIWPVGCGIPLSYSISFETVIFANVPGALCNKNASKEINLIKSSA